MALFNLTDISYRKETNRRLDSLSSLPQEYKTNLLRYPIDVGNTDKAHYMMIHINVQEKTAYQSTFAADKLATIQKNRTALRNQTGATNLGGNAKLLVDGISKLNSSISESDLAKRVKESVADPLANLINSTSFGSQLSQGVSGAKKQAEEDIGKIDNATFLRRIARTTDSLALYMPNTMAYTHQQQYNTLQLGGETAALLGAGGSLLNDAITGKINAEQLGRNLTPFIAQGITRKIGGALNSPNSAQAIFASAIGGVQNPQLELIYGSPNFRTFRFEFMFYPTSEAEALQVQQMIERLKFHQAPEIMTGTAGYFLVPPSEFDIEFYYNGKINPNIPKISTCVLTTIDMDYAPKGWQAYETDKNEPKLGGTGMPFGIRLTLEFQETEIMTKFNFQGERKFVSELRPSENLKK